LGEAAVEGEVAEAEFASFGDSGDACATPSTEEALRDFA